MRPISMSSERIGKSTIKVYGCARPWNQTLGTPQPCFQGANLVYVFLLNGAIYMTRLVCPPWVGYLLVNPVRKLLENPDKIMGRFVREGMVVLEPGCGMGYFTLPLARMVGQKGRVVAVDIEPKMLSMLARRALYLAPHRGVPLLHTKNPPAK